MTVPITFDPGCDAPPEVFVSAAEAAEHITADCLRDGPVGRVGLEIEAHSFDLAHPGRRPDWREVTDAIAGVPALPGGSRITVEPGGAVELSGPPADGAVTAIAAMTSDRALLRAAFAQQGLGLALLGADPLRRPRRVNPGARYAAMESFFTASGTGAAGAFMMTATASVQLNLDAGPRRGWADRVRLAHALGPTMIAVTANSPLLAGRFSGWQSSRQWVWGELDEARCGPVLGERADDPASDWARYALRAPVMLVRNPEPVAVTDWVPFADWADGRTLLGGRRPTREDLTYHLTTLFPPVRPRRWLEIRYLDAVSDALWPAVAFTLTTLLDDPVAADIAAEATESVATAWDRAARIGLGDRRLRASALRCVQTAAELAPAPVMESMQQLVRSVEEGRSPADDFADRAVAHGIGPAVRQLAKGES
ncbi:glutamate--cysteine ligase EgtA [Mycolicibacterium doricum]|uniref:Glutamate--cysteine ligase EgtA n=1 Tax=Mycolicibacterium doricum TaxID=126673 RepID=A0A1X1T3E0_9MYCO|nr:ergothioneine biosynthesis glutamate--cysteine ligase EgtA [Mycolicibacterium doricum]MCV7270026.1 ergothioneine biosynthesis glutamate--cysteine ligase EgtA [Mycolicibacterium doricum]ORV38901.1 ergothioneine biosynthesis glutamate--cysteine ligase EgtA [Mycolicibacterium doricum]BBZ09242.1 glutamate--cysteine ligase EgtA [Mycolicibacterium doricum]